MKLDAVLEKYLNEGYYSGAVCCVNYDGQNIYHKSFGMANRDKSVPCAVDTVFDIASITKIATTTVILQLITKGDLKLSTQLEACLPGISDNKVLSSITIKQLLTHSSGLKAWHPFYSHLPETNLYKILDVIELSHSESERVVYSDINFILLGEVLKNHFDASLQTIINQNLVVPLELKTLCYRPINIHNIAATEYGNQIEMQMCKDKQFHFADWRDVGTPHTGEVNDGNAYYFFRGESGHAGLFSNAEDLVTIGKLYLKGGVFSKEQLIEPELVEKALSPQIENRALGWERSEIYPDGVGHTGFTGTALWVVPDKNLVVALLTNRLHVESPKNINPFRKELFSEILNCIKGS